MDHSALDQIERRIQSACERSGRMWQSVLLLPVSKTQPLAKIKALYDLGIRDFGENRVQELLKKKEELPEDIRWHFIGNLQSNKAKYLTPFIESIDSINSIELATEVSKRATKPISILIEVNISGEGQKHGISPDDVEQVVVEAASFPNLMIKGLMGMASFEEDPEKTRPQFRKLRQLRDEIAERHKGLTSFKELSVGMSNDFEVAIEEGATIVRIGSALFSNE